MRLRPLGLLCPRTPTLSCQRLTFGSLSRRVSVLPVCVHTHTHTHTQLCCSLFLCWAGDHEPKTIKSFQNQQTANTGEFRKVVLSSCLSVLQRDTVVIPGAGTRLYSNNALKDKIQNEIYTFSSTPVATISVQMSIIHSCYCDNKPKHQYWTTIIHLNRMYSSVTADA